MTVLDKILEEISQLLSFARYGKSKLDGLTKELNTLEKSLVRVKNRASLRDFTKTSQVYQVTLISTLDTIKLWQQKVRALTDAAELAGGAPRKLNHKIQRLSRLLTAQENRLQRLMHRYQALLERKQSKTVATRSSIVLARPVMSVAEAS